LIIFRKRFGKLYLKPFPQVEPGEYKDKIFEITSYYLAPNYYHLILKEVAENGLLKFIKSRLVKKYV